MHAFHLCNVCITFSTNEVSQQTDVVKLSALVIDTLATHQTVKIHA